MKRREFLGKSLSASIAATLALQYGTAPRIFGQSSKNENSKLYDLAAVKGGEPDVMFDRAIESLGGMKRFVKKNQTVVVKPKIGWDSSPERAANTNPKLVKRVIEHCFNSGAKNVYVFDHTCDNWRKCYSNSLIEKYAKDAGAKVVSGEEEKYYQNVSISGAKKLKEAKVHELILSSDVFINIPILKDHSSARMSIAMKNLMGVVWDRGEWHRNNLNQCIADYCLHRKPDLNIIDAYYVMKKNGPRGVSTDDVALYKSQILSTDIVACDTAAVKLFGQNLNDVGYLKLAENMKIGRMDLENLSIDRINL